MIVNEQKSQIALLKATLRLTELGYAVYATIGELKHPTDIIGIKNNKCYRFQVKYFDQKRHEVPRGNGNKKYAKDAFDYYAIYLVQKDVVIFPSIDFLSKSIRHEISNGTNEFYWYEDFLEPTDKANKRSRKDFGLDVPDFVKNNFMLRTGPRPENYKVDRPSKLELNHLIWTMPTTDVAKLYNVSDNCIGRWVKDYELTKPPRGYWQRKQAGKI